MTVRISSFQSSPATTFELEADVVDVQPDEGSHGRWRVRFYLNAYNGPGGSTGSFNNNPGVQIGRYGNSNSEFDRHSGNPFLPSGVANGARRWREGPVYQYVYANSKGYYDGGSSRLPLRMDLDYGSIDTNKSGNFVMGRIARPPGKTPAVNFTSQTSTSVTYTGSSPSDTGNSNLTRSQHQIAKKGTGWGSPDQSKLYSYPAGTSSFSFTGLASGQRYAVRVRYENGDGWGDWSNTVYNTTAPGKPGTPTFSNIEPTCVTVSWSAAVGSITNYTLQWSSTSSFSTVNSKTTGTSRTTTVCPLIPGEVYYFRVRATSSFGTGDWSNVGSVRTLPSGPPTMAVVPGSAGRTAVVTLGAPSGMSGVDSYTITATYTAPAPVPNPATLSWTTSTSPFTASGLTPGATYTWAAVANVGSYTSVAVAITGVKQPKPNTSAGDFFDGNTTDTPDENYGWTGTTNNSTSTITAPGVYGWGVFGTPLAVLSSAQGSRTRQYAAQVTILSPLPAETLLAGTSRGGGGSADIASDALYTGSIYVNLPRDQRMRAQIAWFDAGGTQVGTSVGPEVVIAGGDWRRLIVTGTSPSDADRATIQVTDVDGAGWSQWLSGEVFQMDDAMITIGSSPIGYFDGSTPDTSTYDYQWVGTTDNSASQRLDLDPALVDPLLDPDCVVVPPAPRPPTVPSECIDEVGLWRRYLYSIPSTVVAEWLTTVPTLELEAAEQAYRQVRIRYYPNPFGYQFDQLDADEYCSEQIISYIPPNTRLTLDGVSERVYAEVAGASAISADHLLYGTGGTPASWPHLSCGIPYYVSIDVSSDTDLDNLDTYAYLTQRA